MGKVRELEAQNIALLVENFNLKYPVGVTVRFWTGVREGQGRTGKTWTDAMLASHGLPIVYIRDEAGKNVGCVALTHVEVIATSQPVPEPQPTEPETEHHIHEWEGEGGAVPREAKQ